MGFTVGRSPDLISLVVRSGGNHGKTCLLEARGRHRHNKVQQLYQQNDRKVLDPMRNAAADIQKRRFYIGTVLGSRLHT